MQIRIATTGFDPQVETSAFVSGRTDIGAMASFVGYCRDATGGRSVDALHLEHYPGFTEKEISRFCRDICGGLRVSDALIIHRVGAMRPGDPIILVAVVAPHRTEAFAACSALMDYLKTDAPLWKKEIGPAGEYWIEPGEHDLERRAAVERTLS